MNAQCINITKIDDKLTFKLLKMSKQVTISYTILKGHHYYYLKNLLSVLPKKGHRSLTFTI